MRKDFAYLQKRIDSVISSVGLEELITYLDILSLSNEKDKISQFILIAVSSLYKTPVKYIIKEGSKIDTEPRMLLCALHKKYLKLSISKIGGIINRDKARVSNYLKDMDYYLQNPTRNHSLYKNFNLIDSQIKEFIHFIEKPLKKDG